MKKTLLFLIVAIFTYNLIYSQTASTYFPANPGYKWYYKNIPLDSNNNPLVNLTTYRIDSFANVAMYKGLSANVVRFKNWLSSFQQNTPYNDTNYFNFQTTNGWQYMKSSMIIDSVPVPGVLNFLKSLEAWYNMFRFSQAVGTQYTILQKDTTILYDTITVPLRAKATGMRFNDEVVNTVYGNYTAKKFLIEYGLYIHILFYEYPLVVRADTTWLAQNVWMVKEIIPSTKIDLNSIGYPVSYPIPGNMYELAIPTGIRNISSEVPDNFNLYQNYPNPFNPVTKIKFDIPVNVFPHSKRGLKGVVTLKVFDITGREISTLVNEQLSPGTYEVTFNSVNLPSGSYFYKIQAGDFSETKKMLLIK